MRHVPRSAQPSRSGAVLVLASVIMVMIFAFAAFSADVGYMALVKQQLQNAADAAALGAARELGHLPVDVRDAAKEIALENAAAQQPVVLDDADIELGVYDIVTRTFIANETAPNAVRVTARVFNQPLFFAPVIQHNDFDMTASAIAMLNPRDIVIAVDLSGSMNDDTEPCWATPTINSTYGPQGYPTVGNELMQQVYDDLGFGTYPGAYEHIGAGLGVPTDSYAYAVMTQDDGPLTNSALPSKQKIKNPDDEAKRKEKAYSWIIEHQILTLMPGVTPDPTLDSSYPYWEKYLDYIIDDVWVGQYDDNPPSGGGGSSGGGSGGGGDPPSPPSGMFFNPDLWKGLVRRERTRDLGMLAATCPSAALQMLTGGGLDAIVSTPGLPRNGGTAGYNVPTPKDSDEIDNFNNPNHATFPSASSSLPDGWEFKVGYITYVQYLMDWGRDRSPLYPNSSNASTGALPKTVLSLLHPDCQLHTESTSAGQFDFPPSEQPMHAVRRALIAGIDELKFRNSNLQVGAGDNVGIVTFDGLDADHAPQLLVSLTSDYDTAMQACTTLQAVSDVGNTTATEAGLILARNHVRDVADGGQGRPSADDVIVLITDGVPNVIQSNTVTVDDYMSSNGSSEWYGSAYWWYNAPMMQAHQMAQDDVKLYAVGMGLGTDYDFMDRMARLGETDKNGLSPRGSGNPAEYEQVLIDVINEIIRNPGTRIVE